MACIRSSTRRVDTPVRHVTQPAFSRRIQLLEEWLGVSLVDRSTHQITLTRGGERFRPVADEIVRRLLLGREEVRQAAAAAAPQCASRPPTPCR